MLRFMTVDYLVDFLKKNGFDDLLYLELLCSVLAVLVEDIHLGVEVFAEVDQIVVGFL
jgi:hypothetical protein